MAVSKRKTFFAAEYAYVVLSLLLISDALTPILWPGGESFSGPDEGSNPRRLLLAVALYGISAIASVQYGKTILGILRRRPELCTLVAWTMLSMLWADGGIDVFRRATAHLLTVIFCLFIVTRYTRTEFFERLLVALFIGGAVSIVLCILAPGIAVHHGGELEGSWHGTYPHKATLGHVATVAILLSLFIKPETRISRQLRWPTFGIFTILLIMSFSRTGWLTTIASLAVFWVIKLYLLGNVERRLRKLIGVLMLGSVLVGAVASFVVVLTLMGRDLTFSGRTVLWNGAIQVAERGNTWLGVGYKNFWLGKYADQVKPFIEYWPKTPGHGHNGYLDTWLEMGWIGLGLLMFFIIASLVHLIRAQIREPRDNGWTLFFVLFLQFLATNFAASVSTTHTDLTWVTALLATFYTGYSEYALAHRAAKTAERAKVFRVFRKPKLARSVH